MRRAFLRARWCNLILANYAVSEELLRSLLPPGCELDVRDGKHWASLVGFQFLGTRVLGIGWPGFRNFPEWNLRFYVRHQGQRGVCFIREFVPSWMIATTARLLYNEPYHSARMSMAVKDTPESVTATYTVQWGGKRHSLQAVGAKPSFQPGPDSAEQWFKEHFWGFGTSRGRNLIQYEVNHPKWEIYPVRKFGIEVDWSSLYGPEWSEMQGREPDSVVFAVGSNVSVSPRNL